MMISDPLLEPTGCVGVAVHDSSALNSRSHAWCRRAIKRLLDIVLACGGLVAALPIILIAAIAITVVSPEMPVFRQRRIGRFGNAFSIWKLRTMRPGAHLNHQTVLQKEQNDPRIFPLGRFLRRTSIDELPNLINVITGDMSIVGPRPMLESELAFCEIRHGRQVTRRRLNVRPGITGLWQISGRAALHFDERVALDVEYASSWNLRGDFKILLKTLPALFDSRGAF